MIEGVKIKKLKVIPDDRGRLMEILREDDDIFQKFGQVYMTTALPGVIKAWHYHKDQTDNFTCISGRMRLGLYDARKNSPTFGNVEEYIISLDDPLLVRIPPEVYHGFKCISEEEAVVINMLRSLMTRKTRMNTGWIPSTMIYPLTGKRSDHERHSTCRGPGFEAFPAHQDNQ